MTTLPLPGALALNTARQLRYPPYREPHFQSAVLKAKAACLDARDLLLQFEEQDPLAHIREAHRLANYEAPTTYRLGLVGASGDGKSSTLNSILGQQGLAKAEACGKAVTHYPIEFGHTSSTQKAPFYISAKLQRGEVLRDYLCRLLHNFHRPTLEEEEPLSGEEFEDMMANRKEAQEIFNALFGDMCDYQDLTFDLDEQFNMEPALARIAELVTKLRYPPSTTSEGVWEQEAQTPEELDDKLSFIQETGLWPVVEHVKISSSEVKLGRHLVMVDLPGTQDVNTARVNIAMRYRAKCDFLLLVVNIGRVVTNALLEQTVSSMRKEKNEDGTFKFRIAVVCTHAGDIPSGKERLSLEKLVKDKTQLLKAKKDLEQLENNDTIFRPEYVKQKSALEKLIDGILIQARNSRVQAQLHAKYGRDLQVFCVDNTLHWDGNVNEDISGISQLQEFVADLPHEQLFKHNSGFLATDLPAFAQSVETLLSSCRVDKNLDQRPRLPDPDILRETISELRALNADLRRCFAHRIDQPLMQEAYNIVNRCITALDASSKWRWNSVLAWISHRGTHKTTKLGEHCWNSKFVECFRSVLSALWHHLEADSKDSIKRLRGNIESRWKTYRTRCFEADPGSQIPVSVISRLDIIKRIFDSVIKDCHNEVSRIRRDAMSMHPACYVKQIMERGYADAQIPTGKGSMQKRFEILSNHICSNEFVPKYRDYLVTDHSKAVAKAVGRIETCIEQQISIIEADLALVQTPKGQEKLFQKYPELGAKAELMLLRLQKHVLECNEEATTAREMAKEQYGLL